MKPFKHKGDRARYPNVYGVDRQDEGTIMLFENEPKISEIE